MPEQASYADDAEFQRRLAEYKEEELAALEAKLAQQNGYGNSSGYGDNSGLGRDGYRGNSSEAPEGYGRGDEYPAYQRGEDLPTYQRGDDHPAYQRQAEVVPSKGFTAANPYSGEAKQEPIRNGIQRNYLVNNPLVPDQPAQRAAAPQGFRAHQDIKHDQMNIPRGQKSGGMYGSSAQEAYSNIKKKYGNHSAQYNILTGN